jgi:hypothetical protein
MSSRITQRCPKHLYAEEVGSDALNSLKWRGDRIAAYNVALALGHRRCIPATQANIQLVNRIRRTRAAQVDLM